MVIDRSQPITTGYFMGIGHQASEEGEWCSTLEHYKRHGLWDALKGIRLECMVASCQSIPPHCSLREICTY